ncbi:MAG: glycosyltransferase [Caldilineae bacterium]|nr:MAG: glycosyltransferase [Caldilineae bacterium]
MIPIAGKARRKRDRSEYEPTTRWTACARPIAGYTPGGCRVNIGFLHQYSLNSSGSGVYTLQVVPRLLERGHRVCIVCRDFHPEKYPFVEEAVLHHGDRTQQLFRRADSARCTVHTLRGPIMAVAYPRSEDPNGLLYTDLTDQEISTYVDYHVERVEYIARRHRLQLLFANHVVLMPYVALQVKRRLGIPYVVAVHGSTIEYVVNPDERYRRYAVEGLRGAERVIVLNSEVRDRVLGLDPGLRARLVTVPVGVDTRLFHAAGVSAAAQSGNGGENGSGPGRRTIAYLGKLSLEKGIHCLIAALPLVSARVPDAHLLVIGGGVARESLEDMVAALGRGDLAGAAEFLARAPTASQRPGWLRPLTRFWEQVDRPAYLEQAASLPRRVEFTGFVPHPHLAEVLSRAEMLVIPSLVKEAFPLVSLEALACGVLPMGTYQGGLVPVLDHISETLKLPIDLIKVDSREEVFVRDLGLKVAGLLEYLTPEIRTQVASRCRELALQFDWKHVVARLEKLCVQATEAGKP